MKTTKQFSIMMAVVLLSFSINSCKQTKPICSYHTITLHVDTGSIDQQNIDATCNFEQEAGTSNEEYTVKVRLGDTIIWEGVSSSSEEDVVKIKKIKYVKGPKILNKSELIGETSVVGKVKKGKKDDVMEYLIEFTVFNNGIKRNGIFKIDPKLQVVP